MLQQAPHGLVQPKWDTVVVGSDMHFTVLEPSHDVEPPEVHWLAQGLDGLSMVRGGTLHRSLCTDDWNGFITRHRHGPGEPSYAAFEREAALPALRTALSEAGLDPAMAETAYDEGYMRHLYGDAERPGWYFRHVAMPGAVEAVSSLQDMGIDTFIGTNWTLRGLIRTVRDAGFDSHLLPNDRILTSAQLGARKPSPHFFAGMLKAMRVAAHQAVWVGDSWPSDVRGALGVGMRAFWVVGGAPDSPLPTTRPKVEGRPDLDGRPLPPNVRAVHSIAEVPAQLRRVKRSSPQPPALRSVSEPRRRDLGLARLTRALPAGRSRTVRGAV